ncbi:hypothetical protein [Halocola ammonii]
MEAPKVPKVVFRNARNKPRQYKLSKRFYDPEEEERENRRREIEREVAMERGEKVNYAPGKVSFRKQRTKGDHYRKGAMASNLRLIVILAILIILAYMAYQYLEQIGG